MKPDGQKANRLQVCFVKFVLYLTAPSQNGWTLMCGVGVILSIKQYKYTDIILYPKTVNSSHNPEQVSEAVGRGQIDMRSLHEGPLA